MRRLAFIVLILATLACNALTPQPTLPPPTIVPAATPSPLPTLAPTVSPTETASPEPTDLYIAPGDVIFHPEPVLYSGDRVSLEVFAHDGGNFGLSSFSVAVYLSGPSEETRIATTRAIPYGIGERLQATFVWAWDTAGLQGTQLLTVVLDPDDEIQIGDENPNNNTLIVPVDLLPSAELSKTIWLKAESDCCLFNYISGSAAERDIELIKATADKAMNYVEDKLGRQQESKMVFNLIDRLLGHGGFASDTITITYIDRDYAAGSLENVFRHEAAHLLDRQSFGDHPTLITEGLATYVAGGHFKEEPFEPRLVGLLAFGRYIPLTELADNFYPSQHEIGYLEGAAFIDYLVNTYGWKQFVTLLGAFQPTNTQSAMLDGGLRLVYNKSLAEMETEWLAHLRAQTVDPRWQADIADTITFYDTVRRYQQVYDPSAHFLTAWIPDIQRAVRENITADYSRHPSSLENIALETMLIEADRQLETGNYDLTEHYLAAVNAVLESGGNFAADSLATDYLALTASALDAGYEPQRIRLDSDSAAITASRPGQPSALVELTLTRVDGTWRMN
ncbi:MAG: hypothetical protein HYZ49_20900 [Chloroflexi bacterium]|nr:hypothetical protein [Chloroflexota bacterium]